MKLYSKYRCVFILPYDTSCQNYRSTTLILSLLHCNYLCSICLTVLLAGFLLASNWSISSDFGIFTQLTRFLSASSWSFSSRFGIFTQPAFSKVKNKKNMFHIFDRLSCKMRYVCNLELLSVLSTHKQCLNRTFKQAATEPWKANWLRLRIVKRYKSRTLSNSWLQYIASA